jgi:WD40 repeat protein
MDLLESTNARNPGSLDSNTPLSSLEGAEIHHIRPGHMAQLLQLNLQPSPTDIPSALVFHPQRPSSLLVSAWDSSLRYYSISTDPAAQLISQYDHPAPILDCKFSQDGKYAVTGSVNGNVNWYLGRPPKTIPLILSFPFISGLI